MVVFRLPDVCMIDRFFTPVGLSYILLISNWFLKRNFDSDYSGSW